MSRLVEHIHLKRRLLQELENRLSEESKQKAREDHHSRRPPRPCGITVHTGIGCSLCCVYCYIYDMGFPRTVTPYPLSGLEMLYALALNPYFVPGRGGTMIAMGAVSEPFLPETKERSLEYIRTLGTLKNPTQISSKMTLDDGDVESIARACPHISFLMTVVAIRDYRKLEPRAPDPVERFETCRKLVLRDIHVSLFMRPIIPGFTDRDAEDILNMAKSAGVRTVVLGTLRVTRRIFMNLLKIGVDLSRRVKKLSDKEQVPIIGHDLKRRIARLAERLGLRVYEAACGANIEAAGLGCVACEWGPCGSPEKVPNVDEKDIVELCLELGYRVSKVNIHERTIEVYVETGRRIDVLEKWLKELTRRRVIIRRG
ncbi:MAG: radical SAM protein [Crenarchaeota archaeon]|nr:radical SAM protein [Thermoproteota archaeon]